MKIGFVGLGRMGAGMTHRLLDAGHEVHAWNRSDGVPTDRYLDAAYPTPLTAKPTLPPRTFE